MSIQLVVGLGNPGPRYADTRHNIGFSVVDELGRRHAVGPWERYLLCDLGTLAVAGGVLAAKPTTYMNRSGAAVRWLLDRFGLEVENALIVVDDLDLPLGRLRLRRRGSAGTHNGLRDICAAVGEDFPRLRVGVGPPTADEDLASWVTAPFDEEERPAADAAVLRAADAVESAIRDGFDTAMGSFNRRDP